MYLALLIQWSATVSLFLSFSRTLSRLLHPETYSSHLGTGIGITTRRHIGTDSFQLGASRPANASLTEHTELFLERVAVALGSLAAVCVELLAHIPLPEYGVRTHLQACTCIHPVATHARLLQSRHFQPQRQSTGLVRPRMARRNPLRRLARLPGYARAAVAQCGSCASKLDNTSHITRRIWGGVITPSNLLRSAPWRTSSLAASV